MNGIIEKLERALILSIDTEISEKIKEDLKESYYFSYSLNRFLFKVKKDKERLEKIKETERYNESLDKII